MAGFMDNPLSMAMQWLSLRKKTLKDDFLAGLVVAIVALPLALGFAIASSVPPAMGVYTAIIAGFFAAAFGGSEYQISGPTGAMVVVILSVVAKHGVAGLVIATFIAGFLLLLIGLLRLGKVIEYIPSPVIVGFTAGIAFIIFFGQLNNFMGISPSYPEGTEFIGKTIISLQSAGSANLGSLVLWAITIAILVASKKFLKKVPGSIIAVIITTLLAVAFSGFFAVRTVGDIGTIPQGLPVPAIPSLSLSLFLSILPAALTIAALAAIESLLSAVVADGLTDTKHNPNRELIGQGIANLASSLFGGMPATGAIARTATNVRNGGKSRMAAIFHALILLAIVMLLGGLAAKIPLATLAGILMFVAFNMVEWERIFLIFKTPLSDVAVMLTTFLLTIFIDLTVAIEVGLILAALLFMKRMSDLYNVEELERPAGKGDENSLIVRGFRHPDISIYTINGPLFFGAASRFDQQVATTPGGHKPIKIIRMKYVPIIDATGLNFIHTTYHKHRKMGGVVLFSTVRPDVMKVIRQSGLYEQITEKHFFPTTRAALVHALRHAHRLRGQPETVTPEELSLYHLSELDVDESTSPPSSRDSDPVEKILESIGVSDAVYGAKKALKKSRNSGNPKRH